MPAKTKQKPEMIHLSSQDFTDVESRITTGLLTEDDKKIMLSILTTYKWLLAQLQHAKFTMHRLKTMLGFKTERSSNKKKIPKGTNVIDPTPDAAAQLLDQEQNVLELTQKKS